MKYQTNIYVKRNKLNKLKNSLKIVGDNLMLRHIDKQT